MGRWLLAIAVLAVTLGAPSSTAAAPATKVLTLADSGSTVTLVRGQRLHVVLDVCYGCGYGWKTLRAPSRRILRRLPQVVVDDDACTGPCAGGSAQSIFRYAARAAGVTRLRLGYIPPGRQPADKVFELRVRVVRST